MKIARFAFAFLVIAGVAHAQESSPSFQSAANQAIFSPDRLSAEVLRVQGNGVSQRREPTFTREKFTRPNVLLGLGLMATGAVLAATAGESATVTTFNPVTGQPITSTINVTNNGRRWVGIGLLGSGGALTFMGFSD